MLRTMFLAHASSYRWIRDGVRDLRFEWCHGEKETEGQGQGEQQKGHCGEKRGEVDWWIGEDVDVPQFRFV